MNWGRVWFFLILIFSLIGCSSGENPPITLTSTIAVTQSSTPLPTPTKQLPTFTSTPSPYPTPPTPRPTTAMLPEEVNEYVRELLLKNNGCKLLCFWGITLGETTWDEDEELVMPFAYSIFPPDPGMDPASAYVYIRVDKNLYPDEFNRLRFLMLGGVVMEIQGGTGLVQSYNISEFLMTYGKPSEIHLGTWVSKRSLPDYPFKYYLYYPDLGIMAGYWATTNVSEDLVIGCPTNELPPWLNLWEPEKFQSFFDLARLNDPGTEEKYFPDLEDATGMSVEEFYETFIDPESEACFEVPLELFEE